MLTEHLLISSFTGQLPLFVAILMVFLPLVDDGFGNELCPRWIRYGVFAHDLLVVGHLDLRQRRGHQA